MADQSITCPHCGKSIQLTKALTSEIEESLRTEYETKQKRRVESLQADFEKQLAAVKKDAAVSAKKQATEEVSTELADLKQQVQERDKQIESSRKKELELLKKQRELEDKEKTLELDVARKMNEQRKEVEEAVAKRLQDEHHLKDLEKDKQLTDTKRQVEELKRKLEQGSQQTQGEAVEVELEQTLATAFPFDQIEPVPKGIRGADVLQRVHTKSGHYCGTIVWESKNTKNWSDAWLSKLRDDQRKVKAELAVLVSAVLPKTVNHVGMVDGVWVTDFPSSIGLATALRENLLQVAGARLAVVGKNEKMEVIYSYLSGTEFRQRVEAMVESFIAMRHDLDQERRAMEKAWAKREKQIQAFVSSVAGLYGDVQGIIGASSLPKIERLELPAAEG